MKTYSVKEIADMLNTNPETVRRWIRDKKLEATIESKKGGHIVYESALQAFLKSSPKYASIASTAVFSTMMVGGLIAQKIIDVEQLKKARISDADIIKFLQSEIDARTASIESKRENIKQLDIQIKADQIQIEAFQKMIDTPIDDGDDTDLRIKYSSDWLKTASLEELKTEREKVQADYRNPELDIDYRGDLWDLLLEFDTAIGEKQWEGQEPKGPAFNREHGWYLPNDD